MTPTPNKYWTSRLWDLDIYIYVKSVKITIYKYKNIIMQTWKLESLKLGFWSWFLTFRNLTQCEQKGRKGLSNALFRRNLHSDLCVRQTYLFTHGVRKLFSPKLFIQKHQVIAPCAGRSEAWVYTFLKVQGISFCLITRGAPQTHQGPRGVTRAHRWPRLANKSHERPRGAASCNSWGSRAILLSGSGNHRGYYIIPLPANGNHIWFHSIFLPANGNH